MESKHGNRLVRDMIFLGNHMNVMNITDFQVFECTKVQTIPKLQLYKQPRNFNKLS